MAHHTLLTRIAIGAATGALAAGAVTLTRHPGPGAPAPAPTPASAAAPVRAQAPRVTRSQVAATYRSSVLPVNAAQAAFRDKALRWNATTRAAVAVTEAAPLTGAFREVDAELRRLAASYPEASDELARTSRAVDVVAQDLRQLDALGVKFSTTAWLVEYDADIVSLRAAADAVRADLGLPSAGSMTHGDTAPAAPTAPPAQPA